MFTVSSMPHVGGATTMKMIVTFNHLTKIYKYVTQVASNKWLECRIECIVYITAFTSLIVF